MYIADYRQGAAEVSKALKKGQTVGAALELIVWPLERTREFPDWVHMKDQMRFWPTVPRTFDFSSHIFQSACPSQR